MTPSAAAELARYDVQRFDPAVTGAGFRLPLADEPFVACWAEWAEQARREGAFAVLSRHLPQLRFPIRAGIADGDDYRAATRGGADPGGLADATGLVLERPEAVELEVYAGCACRIPVITVRRRPEFESLLRALARRNEPVPVAAEQGALMVSGYVNWERVRRLRQAWEELPPDAREAPTWPDELARIKPRRELYQDRFILISDGPYSAVPAAELGLDEARWRELSLAIRREHEHTHYLTRRLLGSMRNHLLDELMADYAGIVAAIGRFRAGWFLRFLGLDQAAGGRPHGERPSGEPRPRRFDLYRGDPPLSDAACALLAERVRRVAENVERFDRQTFVGEAPGREMAPARPRTDADRVAAMLTLARFRLEELAASGAADRLGEAFEEARGRVVESGAAGPPSGSRD